MKFLFSLVFFSLNVVCFTQKNISSIINSKYETSPFESILFADSILGKNNDFPDSVIITLEHYRALSYLALNNNKKTIELYKKLLPKVEVKSLLHVKILLNMSNANVALLNYTDATNQAIEALNISENQHYNNLIASSQNALSYIHFKNNDFKKSLEYLEHTVDLYIKEKDSVKLASTYNNIAIIFNRQNDYLKSLEYNNKALKISLSIADWIGVGKSYTNIGRVYELKEDYSKAINYYHLSINNNIEHTISNSIPYRNIGDVYQKLNELDSITKYYNQALDIELANNNQTIIQTIYNNLLRVAIKKNQFENALKYQSKVDSLNKLKLEHESKESLKMLKNQYKLADSQKEIEYQKEQVKQINEINFKNKIIFGGIVTSLILLFLFLYQRIKNSKLKESKEKLILEQKVLRAQMNPHFIFNALSAIQNSSRTPMISTYFKTKSLNNYIDLLITPRINYNFNEHLFLDFNIPLRVYRIGIKHTKYETPQIPIKNQKITTISGYGFPKLLTFKIGIGYTF